MRRHDIFIDESVRWGDPCAKLLSGPAWERVRPTICQSLGRSVTPEPELEELARQLDAAYRIAAAGFPQTIARIEPRKQRSGHERDTLILTGLERVEEPESLQRLRVQVARACRWWICPNSCMIVAIGSIHNFPSASTLKSYFGWAPVVAQSGTTLDHVRLTRGGTQTMKQMLFLAVFQAVRLQDSVDAVAAPHPGLVWARPTDAGLL